MVWMALSSNGMPLIYLIHFISKYKGNTYALKMYDISVLHEDMNFERADKEEEKVSEEPYMSRSIS